MAHDLTFHQSNSSLYTITIFLNSNIEPQNLTPDNGTFGTVEGPIIFVDRSTPRNYLAGTKARTKRDVKSFQDWFINRGLDCDIENQTNNEINELLKCFYQEARTKDGRPYTRSTLLGIRSSVNRYLNSLPHGRTISLVKDEEFSSSNRLLERMVDHEKKREKGTIKVPMSDDDITTLMNSSIISFSDRISIQRKVWFDLILHFGLKGNDAMRTLSRQSFVLETDGNGKKYFRLNYEDEMDKIETFSEMHDWHWYSRMYEMPDNPNCPVKCLTLYLSKLDPTCDEFFQRSAENIPGNTGCWYSGPMGHKTILKMMAEMSEDAQLSRTYTNTCLKATVMQLLDKQELYTDLVFNIQMKGSNMFHVQSDEEMFENSCLLHDLFYSRISS